MNVRIESQTEAFSAVLLELVTADPRVYALSADMGSRIIAAFMKARPDRYLNFGIAEQGMVGAAGLALSGLIPFVTTISVFLGNDVTLLATGTLLGAALQAAEELARRGIEARVLSVPTVKPLDEAAVLRAATETRGLVTIEDNRLTGGFGSAVAEFLGRTRPTPLRMIGIPEVYPVVGTPEELYREYHMDVPDIVAAALDLCSARRKRVRT